MGHRHGVIQRGGAPVGSEVGTDSKTSGYTMTLLPDGQVLAVGGRDATSTPGHRSGLVTDFTDLWLPGERSVTPGPALAVARYGHTATLLHDGRVLIVGGFGSNMVKVGPRVSVPEELASAEIYH